MANFSDDEKERTLWCGNLHQKVTEEVLYELFLQAGPLEKVKLVKNKNYAFITFKHAVSVPYTIQLMNGIRLYQKPVQLQTRTGVNSGSGQVGTPNLTAFPASAVMMASSGSNGSDFMQTLPASPVYVANAFTQNVTNTFNRSLSHPNFTRDQKSNSAPNCNAVDYMQKAPGKTQLLHQLSHRVILPYARIVGDNQRFDQNKRNNSFNQVSYQNGSFAVNPKFNGIAAVPWSNHKIAFQRRY